jgi:protease-4
MKQFLHSLLGTLAGLAVFSIVAVVLGFGVLGAIIAVGSGGDAPTIERGSYLVFDLSSTVTDAPDSGIAAALELADGDSLQLRQLTAALRAAADDERIAGVLLRGELLALSGASGFASLREVRLALEDFRASGKPVKAYLTSASTSDYYLASVADEIVLDPYGMILMPGLASEPVFLAGAFERFGVGVQVTRVGRYKSAIEPFTRSDMSPENREELQKLLDDIWASLLADIAQRRGVSVADIQGVVDAEGILRADAALEARLVDRVAYVDEVIADLRQETGRARGPRNTFRQMDFLSYAEMVVDEDQPSSGDAIGVVYAEGNIVDGEGDLGQVGGARFARNLRAMRQDSSIKAIVLRVNSPGGSATASEAIQREVRLTRMSKPVVVSMGSYAASGGYWISAYGNWIFA